ncbi:MAG: hypothetical protein QXP31_05265 [Pyrobaculum sp.]
MEYREEVFRKAVEEAPHVKAVADKAYVVSLREEANRAEVVFAYPVIVGGKVAWETFRLWTDWHLYRLHCEGPCLKLGEVARALDEKAKEEWGHYKLGATAGKAFYYLLRRRYGYGISLGGKAEGRPWMDKARVEVLEVRENGEVKFRIWFYRWLDTRPHQPFVDVEIKYDSRRKGFRGWLYVNVYEGIYKEHLVELHQLFEREGLKATLVWDGDEIERLVFYGAFREELLRRIGYRPERVEAEPVSVKHLGELKFEVGGVEVEFAKSSKKDRPLYAVLQFGTADEAVDFYRRLTAAGVYAEVRGREVRLDEESYWGMVITSGVVPEGWQLVYPLEGDQYRDLHLFKREGEKGVFYQFVVKVGGVWRSAGNWYEERRVMLHHSDRAVLEALREAVKRAVGVELGEIGEIRGVYRIHVTRPVLEAFENRAPVVAVGKSEVHIDGDFIVIKHGGVEHRVKFELVKRTEGVVVDSSLRPVLEALGVPFKWTPEGLKLERDGMWGLLAAALEAQGGQIKLPEGVSIIAARPERGHYILRVKAGNGEYVYSVLKVDGEWTAMGGKMDKRRQVVLSHSDEGIARAHAEAINELLAKCIAEGRCTPKEPTKPQNSLVWRFYLYKTEIEEVERR